MKPSLPVLILILLGASACAHNPRPESPEQRAERQAQSLQAQQDAQSDPRAVGFSDSEEVRDDERQASSQQQENNPPEDAMTPEQARAQARQRVQSTRSSMRSVTMPVYTGVSGVTGGILR